jgi:hypothetical protein
MSVTRRGILTLLAAPAIVRFELLMPVKRLILPSITATKGTWNDEPAYAYEWRANNEIIAIGADYTPVEADIGRNLTFTITYATSEPK